MTPDPFNLSQDDVLAIDLKMPIFSDKNHIDNSQFGPAIKQMQEHSARAKELLSANLVLKEFGMIAHAIEDFYAHSNYVEFMDSQAGGKSTIGSIPIASSLLTGISASIPDGVLSGKFNLINPSTYLSWFGKVPNSHEAINKDSVKTKEGNTPNKAGVKYYYLAEDLAIRTTAAAWTVFFDSLASGMQSWIRNIK